MRGGRLNNRGASLASRALPLNALALDDPGNLSAATKTTEAVVRARRSVRTMALTVSMVVKPFEFEQACRILHDKP